MSSARRHLTRVISFSTEAAPLVGPVLAEWGRKLGSRAEGGGPGPRACKGYSQQNRSRSSVNNHRETMGGSSLQIRSLTLIRKMRSPVRKTRTRCDCTARAGGPCSRLPGSSLRLGRVGCGWRWAPISTLPLGGLCVWGRRSEHPKPRVSRLLTLPCPSTRGTRVNPDPRDTPSPPPHTRPPLQSCPQAAVFPLRPDCASRQSRPPAG